MRLRSILLAAALIVVLGGVSSKSPAQPIQAVRPSEGTSLFGYGFYGHECKTDENCQDVRHPPCTEVKCLPASSTSLGADGETVTTTSSNCNIVPLEKYAGGKDPAGAHCCRLGFDDVKGGDEFACCRKYFESRPMPELGKRESGLSGLKPVDYYKDLFKWIYRTCLNTCTPPRPLDCNIFKDEATRACCATHKGVPTMAIGMCVKPGECSNVINIEAGPGAKVDLSNFNQCCQAVTNAGTMTDTSVDQLCNNIIPGGGTAPGETPATTPSGSTAAATAAQCSCTPRETIKGTAFAGTPWDCEYKAPSSEGPLSLSAAANLVVTTEAPFNVVDPAGGEMKSARLPNTSNKFEVRGPVLANWHDNPDNAGKVTACAQDVAGSNLSCGDCLVATKAQLFGGAGGEGGCSLIREAAAQETLERQPIDVPERCAKYKTANDKDGFICCMGGFDEATDPDEFKCCKKYVESRMVEPVKEAPSLSKELSKEGTEKTVLTPYRPSYTPHSPYYDFFRWMYRVCLNDCPDRKPLDCSIFKDEETKACCAKFEEFPALAIAKCVKPENCTNAINIVAAEGATVNMGNFNQCCQAVTNTGNMTNVTVSQACNNVTPGAGGGSTGAATGGTTGGGAITAPSGSPSSSGAPADSGGCSLIR